MRSLISLLVLLTPQLPIVRASDDLWAQYMAQMEAKKYESTISRRERNLDHWDVPTAAAYLGLHPETLKPLPQHASEELPSSSSDGSGDATELVDEYVGHDAAVLFYAQWCNNCHAVAPSWDAIATHVSAGSRSSKLIMALFDCEKDARHMELCVAAGVKAYPTMMFVGSGEFHDTDVLTKSVLGKDKSAGPFGATTLPRTVKFQGNWQYGDQLLDWVNIMRGLSSWHTMSESGPLRGLRNGIFGFLTGGKGKRASSAAKLGKEGSLPVGVPPGFQSELRGTGGSGKPAAAAAIDDAKVKALEQTLNVTKKEKELYEKAVTHSSNLLDGMLFPDEENSPKKGRDIFSTLTSTDGWFNNATTIPSGAPNDEHPSILRSCAMELSIDYCNRLTSRETNAYVELLTAIPESDPFPPLEEIEQTLLDAVKSKEPYCSLLESCILSDYEAEECRPAQCPFENSAACTYLESCFDPSVQTEYGIALGLLSEGEKLSEKIWDEKKDDAATASTDADGGVKSAGVQGWGVPAS
mmetsp:Transcript_25112/g.37324  ORF Transcript_25112/g.37324 Transcript_25112/m.37324 type:complete len:525 (-) Transcript_25112:106-1680(-)